MTSRPRVNWSSLFAIFVALSLIAAACGGGDDSDGDAETSADSTASSALSTRTCATSILTTGWPHSTVSPLRRTWDGLSERFFRMWRRVSNTNSTK